MEDTELSLTTAGAKRAIDIITRIELTGDPTVTHEEVILLAMYYYVMSSTRLADSYTKDQLDTIDKTLQSVRKILGRMDKLDKSVLERLGGPRHR